MAITLFIYFLNLRFCQRLFARHRPNEIPDKQKINSCDKDISSILED